MRIFFRSKICSRIFLGFAILMVLTASIYGLFTPEPVAEQAASYTQHPVTIVIDAGHGGEDGGAVTADGVKESDINLDISLRLESVLNLYGVNTVMTRSDDNAIYSDDAVTLRQKKTSDLKNRVELINSTPGAFLISIHQNNFSSSQYSGAQVFFSASDPIGAEVAVYAQENLRLTLDNSNTRQAAVISDSIYLMKNIECSGILVECGFLSNVNEASMLQQPEYQIDIAKAITATVIQHCI